MYKHIRLLLLLACSFFSIDRPSACGYAWISDCSSLVFLRINGSLDSFIIADCPFGHAFNGIQMGSVQSLSLTDARAITWESCQNNVSAVKLAYRVYEPGMPEGNFQVINMTDDHTLLEGAYTTRFRKMPVDISLTDGLTEGNSYILELYMIAEIDTIGDDFIPETTLLRNNEGANYKLSFQYGGVSASPLLILPHLKNPLCNGDSNGQIVVSVYGDQSGLFYSWSNISLNFFQQNSLPAGEYGITVSNSLGQTASSMMVLSQPDSLGATFSEIQSAGCNNLPGHATVAPTGGTAPFQYLWETGEQSPGATLPSGGNWRVTISDAHQCSAIASVFISNSDLVERNITAEICQYSSYSIGGMLFSQPGQYTFQVSGNGNCDTLIHLQLNVIDPYALLWAIPDSVVLTCFQDTFEICAEAASDASYQWWKNGDLLGNQPCIVLSDSGNYTIQTTLSGNAGVCSGARTVQVAMQQEPPQLQLNSADASSALAADGQASATVTGSQPPVTYQWSNGSMADHIEQLAPGTYCVTVTAATGCTTEACVVISYVSGTKDLIETEWRAYPNPAKAGDFISVYAPGLPDAGYKVIFEGMEGKVLGESAMWFTSGAGRFQIPGQMRSGVLRISIIGAGKRLVCSMLLLE